MKLFVAGATGRTGRAFVAAAHAHDVTVFARTAAPGAIVGDVLDPATIRIAPDQIVVSTLGGAVGAGTANLVAAATAAGARRMLALVGAGVLQLDDTRLRNESPDYPPFLREVGKQHMAAYQALRDSALDWTLVCVPNIVDGPATGSVTSAANVLPAGSGRITTGDIAAFLLREVESPSFVRSRVGLNS